MERKVISWMCIEVKYGIWNVNEPDASAVNTLVRTGYAPLAAMVLASRGICDKKQAHKYLDCNAPLPDPYLMTDMDLAAGRVGLAIERGEKIAVFGDYDVEGITSTCMLTDFLRRQGANCISYIPSRLEEGYGLNPIAIEQLSAEGVNLIISVDCGITAIAEAELCREKGIDLVITDHHECKDRLPAAVAVVDPHRPDGGYPHKNLSGVGVAFKLACALCGDQEAVLRDYADMVCLGTVADVMPLQGENRVFVARGLELGAAAAAELIVLIPGEQVPAGHGGKADVLADGLAKAGGGFIGKAGNFSCFTHPKVKIVVLHGEDELGFVSAPGFPFTADRFCLLPGGEGQYILFIPVDEDIPASHAQQNITTGWEFFVILVIQISKIKILQHDGFLSFLHVHSLHCIRCQIQ